MSETEKRANVIGDLRVWWVPQVPMDAFYVDVSSVEEGVKIMDVLASYDAFQFENNVKPDYCNMGGLQVFGGEEFVDWYYEDGDFNYFDDPRDYVEWRAAQTEQEPAR